MRCSYSLKYHAILIIYLLFSTYSSGQPSDAKYASIDEPDPQRKINIVLQEGSSFLQISNSLFNRDILIVSKISKSAANHYLNPLYVGDLAGRKIVQFSMGLNNKVYVKTSSYFDRVKDTMSKELSISIDKNNNFPLVATLDIVSSHSMSHTTIDITELLKNDGELFFFGSNQKSQFNLGSYQPDKSFLVSISPFHDGVDVKTVKTYLKQNDFVSYELTSTLLPLPEIPMRIRKYDERIGYNTSSWTEFSDESYGSQKVKVVHRWRIEPKPREVDSYLKGVLVEPAKPIIFYLDSLIPAKWVPFIKKGVEAWQVAFEKAGFKNAIIAKEIKKETNLIGGESIRNMIFWSPSLGDNANGTTIVDTRSGEIINATVKIDHNELRWLQDTYFILASPIDSRARNLDFEENYMGELISSVITHEVGHTLGLDHNFTASSTVSVDNLRNKEWVDSNGFCPSIMDYARFNYIAQVSDKMTNKQLERKIGAYDIWAIEWGYRWFNKWKNSEDEVKYFDNWVSRNIKNDCKLLFNPRNGVDLKEDLSDDAIEASLLGITNLKIVAENFQNWTSESDGEARLRLYDKLVVQFNSYLEHVFIQMGTKGQIMHCLSETKGGDWAAFNKFLKRSLLFFDSEISQTPIWLIDCGKGITGLNNPGFILLNLQENIISKLLSDQTLTSFLETEYFHKKDSKIIAVFLEGLTESVFNEISNGSEIDLFRRNLQRVYVNKLINSLLSVNRSRILQFTDVPSYLKIHILALSARIADSQKFYEKRPAVQTHLADLTLILKSIQN